MAQRSRFTGTNVSCGVHQLHGLHDTPEEVLTEAFQGACDRVDFAHIVFSDVFGNRYRESVDGAALAKFIMKQGLGTVIKSPVRVNPNSGNRIAVWVWTPNKKALRAWLKKGTRKV